MSIEHDRSQTNQYPKMKEAYNINTLRKPSFYGKWTSVHRKRTNRREQIDILLIEARKDNTKNVKMKTGKKSIPFSQRIRILISKK